MLWERGIYFLSGGRTYKPEEIKGMIECQYHSVCFRTYNGKYLHTIQSVWLFHSNWRQDLISLCNHWSGWYPDIYAYAPIDEPVPKTPDDVSDFLMTGIHQSVNERNLDLLMQH